MSDETNGNGSDVKKPTKVVVHGEPTVLLDGFFKVNKYEVLYGTYAGGDNVLSPKLPRIVADRGHSVAALLYNPEERQVILVEQFRLPTFGRLPGVKDSALGSAGSGWILETAAGAIGANETPIQCLIREVREETGYEVKDAYEIADFYPSPGGTSERIKLYLAEVSRHDRFSRDTSKSKDTQVLTVDNTATRPGDYEDICVRHIPQDEFFRMLDARELIDAKLIIAAYFLKDRISHSDRAIPKGRSTATDFVLKGTKGRHQLIIGIRPGDMLDWSGIPIWVNSENTDMEMDRFYAKSVSATIRYHGAQHSTEGRVTKDIVADALRKARGRHGHVDIAHVLETEAGQLNSLGVRKILHVAAVVGAVGTGKVQFDIRNLEKCVGAVLSQIDLMNSWSTDKESYGSVLIPMLGAGQGGGSIENIAQLIVDRCLTYLLARQKKEAEGERARGLRSIYLSAYSERVEAALKRILAQRAELEPLTQETADAER